MARRVQPDEYGDMPGTGGTQWATMDTVRTDAAYTDVHTRGTIRRQRDGRPVTEFWMTSPKPRGMTVAEWEAITQDRYDRAFGKGKYAKEEAA